MFYKLSYQEQIALLNLFLEKYSEYRKFIPNPRHYALFGTPFNTNNEYLGNEDLENQDLGNEYLENEYLENEHFKMEEILNRVAKDYIEQNKPFSKSLNINIFRSRSFFVNEYVLDPRPETEEIIDILKLVNLNPRGTSRCTMLELGVGSGVISISAKLEFPNLDITAIDISDEALKVAKYNGKIHRTPIKFLKNNWLDGMGDSQGDFYDICISNPPYLYENEMKIYPELDYDPDIALLGKNLYFYREIEKKKHHFNSIILEIHPRDSGLLQDLFPNSIIFQDFNNLDRFLYYSKFI